jgi:hypothetical protein
MFAQVNILEGRDDVDVKRRTGFAGDGAGEGASHRVSDPELVERFSDRNRDGYRIEKVGHTRSSASISG